MENKFWTLLKFIYWLEGSRILNSAVCKSLLFFRQFSTFFLYFFTWDFSFYFLSTDSCHICHHYHHYNHYYCYYQLLYTKIVMGIFHTVVRYFIVIIIITIIVPVSSTFPLLGIYFCRIVKSLMFLDLKTNATLLSSFR